MGFFGDILKSGMGLVAGIGQIGLGIGQLAKARKMEYPELQQYDIPDEYLENMSQAELMSFIGLPQAQKQEFVENIQRAGATALKEAGTRKGGLGIIPSIQQQQQDAYKSLLSADAKARQENINILLTARSAYGEQKTMEQQREFDVTAEKRGLRQEMMGAAFQNIGGGLGTMAGGATQFRSDSTNPYAATGGFGNQAAEVTYGSPSNVATFN
jgi:hypothetical protein